MVGDNVCCCLGKYVVRDGLDIVVINLLFGFFWWIILGLFDIMVLGMLFL